VQIENYIPFGKSNAISRTSLCSVVGLSDRIIRSRIEEARRRGIIIINTQNGRGYFRTRNLDDIKCQYLLNKSRANAILSQQKFLLIHLHEAGVAV